MLELPDMTSSTYLLLQNRRVKSISQWEALYHVIEYLCGPMRGAHDRFPQQYCQCSAGQWFKSEPWNWAQPQDREISLFKFQKLINEVKMREFMTINLSKRMATFLLFLSCFDSLVYCKYFSANIRNQHIQYWTSFFQGSAVWLKQRLINT